MLRAFTALLFWIGVLVFLGIPLVLTAMVRPSRRFLAWTARFWARNILRICGAKLLVQGQSNFSDGRARFFVGNHQSALDIPVLMAALNGEVRFMAKDSLFRIPVLGWIMSRYDFVPVDRSNARRAHQALERMVERVRKDPISYAVFPEGTRSRDGGLLPFRRGTIKICQRSGLPVVPFAINGALAVHHRDDLFRAKPGPIRLTFGRPIPAEEVSTMSANDLYERVRSEVEVQLRSPAPFETCVSRMLAAEGH